MTVPAGTLTDTGLLFALVDVQGQPEQYVRCQALIPSLAVPLVTTWPCFTEALYLCRQRGGRPLQRLLWVLWEGRTVRIHAPTEAETARALELMETYNDMPMDLAGASLIALAEARGYGRVFSIDSDFYVYRLADGTALEAVPGPMLQRGKTQ